MKENAKQLSASRTHRSTKRVSGAVTVIWWENWCCGRSVMVVLTFVRVRLETRPELKIRLGRQRTWGWRTEKFS